MSAASDRSRPTLAQRAVLMMASVFGLGYLPRAPGTFGTLAGLPLWWAMTRLPLWAFVVCTAAMVVGAVLISAAAERIYGAHDVQHIVIDEVVGLLVTVIGVPFSWRQAAVAFVVFRALDMFKPPPIGLVDRRMSGGLGVVLDDVVAGVIGCAILHLLRAWLGSWW